MSPHSTFRPGCHCHLRPNQRPEPVTRKKHPTSVKEPRSFIPKMTAPQNPQNLKNTKKQKTQHKQANSEAQQRCVMFVFCSPRAFLRVTLPQPPVSNVKTTADARQKSTQTCKSYCSNSEARRSRGTSKQLNKKHAKSYCSIHTDTMIIE